MFHRRKVNHGPFDFYICDICKSGITFPLPSENQIIELYSSFSNGVDPQTRKVRDHSSLKLWFLKCISRALKLTPHIDKRESRFSWIDLGAGNGEMSILLAQLYPNSNGVAVDIHSNPNTLEKFKNIEWIQCDFDVDGLSKNFR